MSIALTLICAVVLTLSPSNDGNILIAILVITMVCIINAGYGGGFSNLPTLLSDNFGMKNISSIHGIALSAWAFAGLCGNQMATGIVDAGLGYQTVLYVTCALFAVALIIDFILVKSKPKVVEMKNEDTKENTNENKSTDEQVSINASENIVLEESIENGANDEMHNVKDNKIEEKSSDDFDEITTTENK